MTRFQLDCFAFLPTPVSSTGEIESVLARLLIQLIRLDLLLALTHFQLDCHGDFTKVWPLLALLK